MATEAERVQRPSGRPQVAALVLSALAAATFGRMMSQIPSPSVQGIFWVGNLCAPWLALAFVAGRTQRSWRWAVLVGALSDVACVAGFYAGSLFRPADAYGLPADVGAADYAAAALGHWLRFVARWVVVAVVAGGVYGALGQWWARRAPLAVALAIGTPFVAEPVLWTLVRIHVTWPVVASEVALGAALTAWMVSRHLAARSRPTGH